MPDVPKPPSGEKYDAAANDWRAGQDEAEMAKKKPKPSSPPKPKMYAKGGMTGARGDGCCTKGKTKGRVV
jgi:hypothetical protein